MIESIAHVEEYNVEQWCSHAFFWGGGGGVDHLTGPECTAKIKKFEIAIKRHFHSSFTINLYFSIEFSIVSFKEAHFQMKLSKNLKKIWVGGRGRADAPPPPDA